jgi:hypothetical protein
MEYIDYSVLDVDVICFVERKKKKKKKRDENGDTRGATMHFVAFE